MKYSAVTMSLQFYVNRNEKLGSGPFGTNVYQGKFNSLNVAVKVYNEAKENTVVEKDVKLVMCNIMNKEHDNVVQYYHTERAVDKSLLVVLELCDTNLKQYIITTKQASIDRNAICYQIVDGISFLHENKIVHGNLMPTNVLISNRTNSPVIKLCDFGLHSARRQRWTTISNSSTYIHTTEWMAPEILRGIQKMDRRPAADQQYDDTIDLSYSSDIFSLGCLLYFVITKGAHLFGDRLRRAGNILHGRRQMQIRKIETNSQSLLYIIHIMADTAPEKRPTAKNLTSFCTFWNGEMDQGFLSDLFHLLNDFSIELKSCINGLKDSMTNFIRVNKCSELSHDSVDIIEDPEKLKAFISARLSDRFAELSNEKCTISEISKKFWLDKNYSYFRLFLWEAFSNYRHHLEKYYDSDTNYFPVGVMGVLADLFTSRKESSSEPFSDDSYLGDEDEGVNEPQYLTNLHESCEDKLIAASRDGSFVKLLTNYEETARTCLITTSLILTLLREAVQNTVLKNSYDIIQRKSIVDFLIQKDEQILYQENEDGNGILHLPSIHVDLIIHLIKVGASVMATNGKGKTIMHICPSYVSPSEYHLLVSLVIHRRLDHVFSLESNAGRIPLHCAVKHLEITRETLELLSQRNKLHITNKSASGMTIYEQAVKGGRSPNFLKLLVEFGSEKMQSNITIKMPSPVRGKCNELSASPVQIHSDKDIDTFIKDISRSPQLLCKLEAAEVLTQQENLTLLHMENTTEQALELYRILQTKRHSYERMKNVLLEENLLCAETVLQQWYTAISAPKHELTYDKKNILGRGCLNTRVYKGSFGHIPVAVKVVNCDDIDKHQAMKEVERFRDLQGQESDNIIRYYHAEEENGFLLIALELCDCNLAECLKDNVMELVAPNVLLQITKGLDFLHNAGIGILHLDLKPENILLKKGHKGSIIVKLSDFGVAKKMIQDDQSVLTVNTSSGIGTLGWIAPELQIKQDGSGRKATASRASDIFSLGCVFYYVISSGRHPFGDRLYCTANIADDKPQMSAAHLTGSSMDYFWLVRVMISHNPVQRPTASAIMRHLVFWPNEFSLKFISHVDKCLQNNIPKFISCIKRYVDFLQSIGSASSVVSNTWADLLCSNVNLYVSSHLFSTTSKSSIQQLIQVIALLYNNYRVLPEKVQQSLGKLPDEFLIYWTSRFPFLLSTLWIYFEDVEGEDGMDIFYEGFHYSYKSPAASLAIEEAFNSNTAGVTVYRDRRRLLMEYRADKFRNQTLHTIDEHPSPSSSGNNVSDSLEPTPASTTAVILAGQCQHIFEKYEQPRPSEDIPSIEGSTQLPNREFASNSASPETRNEGTVGKPSSTTTSPMDLISQAIQEDDAGQLQIACSLFEATDKKSTLDILRKWDETCTGSVLHYAVKEGSIGSVEYFVNQQHFTGALNDPRMHNLVHTCVEDTLQSSEDNISSRVQILDLLIQRNKELISEVNGAGETPLHLQGIHPKLISKLISCGGSVAALGPNGNTALHLIPAAYTTGEGFHDLIRQLGKRDLDVFSVRSNHGDFPLHCAVMHYNVLPKTLELLKSENVLDLNAQDDQGCTLLLKAVIGQRSGEYLHSLVTSFQANIDQKDYANLTGLHLAAMHGNVSALKYFISEKPDFVHLTDRRGRTPLHCAYIHRNDNTMEITQKLLNSGVPLNERTSVSSGSKVAMHYLIELSKKSYPASSAIWIVSILKLLLASGADPCMADGNGNTVLHLAFEVQHQELLVSLLQIEALQSCVCIRNNNGETPMHIMFEAVKNRKLHISNDVAKAIEGHFLNSSNFHIQNNIGNSVWDLCRQAHESGTIDEETFKRFSSYVSDNSPDELH